MKHLPKARFFAEFILSEVEGLRMTLWKTGLLGLALKRYNLSRSQKITPGILQFRLATLFTMQEIRKALHQAYVKVRF
jgi:hypothetical protein